MSFPRPRFQNTLIWSSEGAPNLSNAPALTAAQKAATGSSPILGAAAGVMVGLDLTQFQTFELVVILASFTGGTTPTFGPELDILDDTATADLVPVFKPTPAGAATKWFTELLAFPYSGAAPVISGFTVTQLPGLPVLPRAQFNWTVAGAPTAVAWVAHLYGF